MQEEQHDDGFRGIGVIRSRVHVRKQTCNIQCFLYHITHFAIALQTCLDLEEGGAEHDTGLGPGVALCTGIHVTVMNPSLSPASLSSAGVWPISAVETTGAPLTTVPYIIRSLF